ncbi:MAG: phosphate butyryltransferase [Candidatus Riflebacteria bacterium]|nr:phosphate butyryltransferase [Candidatus Riflebacteria bacterium]
MNFAWLDTHLEARRIPLAVCMPEEAEIVSAAKEASELGYVDCLFVGNREKMQAAIALAAPGFAPEMIETSSDEEAAAASVRLVREGRAKALMKGVIPTPTLLKAILNNETGIKKSSVLSHVLIFEYQGRFRFLTDGGMIPHPTLAEKQEILANAVFLAQRLGFEKPRVAVLAAIETVNPKMACTSDAAILSKMGERKQFGSCIVDGPLALDNAISLEAAHHKGLFNEVVGEAEILICPDIDCGNILGKSIIYFSKCPAGGMIVGAQAPVILLSRSDTKEVRINSIKLALAAGC